MHYIASSNHFMGQQCTKHKFWIASPSNQNCKSMLTALSMCGLPVVPCPSAVVKTALESTKKKALRREQNSYLIPGIRSEPTL